MFFITFKHCSYVRFAISVLLGIVLAGTVLAEENLIEGIFAPVDGQPSNAFDTSGMRAAILDWLTIEEDAHVIETKGFEDEDATILASVPLSQVEVGQKYLLSVDVDVESMEMLSRDGASRTPLQGVSIYFYQTGGRGVHRWAGITGDGSTNGWVTVTIPIDTEQEAGLAKGYILITVSRVKGKIRLQNFKLWTATGELPPVPIFKMPDGTEILQSIYRL